MRASADDRGIGIRAEVGGGNANPADRTCKHGTAGQLVSNEPEDDPASDAWSRVPPAREFAIAYISPRENSCFTELSRSDVTYSWYA